MSTAMQPFPLGGSGEAGKAPTTSLAVAKSCIMRLRSSASAPDAPLLDSDVKNKKSEILFDLVARSYDRPFRRALVVGCGSGVEADLLRQRFDCEVDGIDVEDRFALRSPDVRFHVMDAARMAFEEASFDFLYSFHVIEHIADLNAAFAEMRRVLKPSGVFCIGTPNKRRVVGYLGVAMPLRDKIVWNFEDWLIRVAGRWENRLGAHAGFFREELQALCASAFGRSNDCTDGYYRALYPAQRVLIETIIRTGVADRVFPAVYAIGEKAERS